MSLRQWGRWSHCGLIAFSLAFFSYVFSSRPQDVIIFVIGGSTYEEARAVAKLNEQLASGLPGTSQGPMGGGSTRLLLGGTGVLNSRECVFSPTRVYFFPVPRLICFLALAASWPWSVMRPDDSLNLSLPPLLQHGRTLHNNRRQRPVKGTHRD
jgi:Sec1 family